MAGVGKYPSARTRSGHGQGVGGEDREIGQLAGLDGAPVIFAHAQIGTVQAGRAQGFLARNPFVRRDHLAGRLIDPGDRLPDRMKQRNRLVVGGQGKRHASLAQALVGRNVIHPLGPQLVAQARRDAVDIAVGVGGGDQAHIADAADLFIIEHADMTEHPALVGDRLDAVDLFQDLKHGRGDRRNADIVPRRLDHQGNQLVAGQGVIVIAAGPSGIGVGLGAQPIRHGLGRAGRTFFQGKQPPHPEMAVPQPRPGQRAGPGAEQGRRIDRAQALPGWAERQLGAHGQVAPRRERLVGLDHLGGVAVALEHRGGSDPEIDLQGALQAAHSLIVGEAAHLAKEGQLHDRRQTVLEENAGRLAAAWILVDFDDGAGCFRVARDAGQFQGPGIGDGDQRVAHIVAPIAPDGADIDRVFRRYPIQIVARRKAPVGQLVGTANIIGRAAQGHGHHPFARLFAGDQRFDDLQDLVDRGGAGQARIDFGQALAVHMGVTVDKARYHGPPREIDRAGMSAGQGKHRGAIAHLDNPLALDGDGVGDGEPPIERDHLAAVKNIIRSRRPVGHVPSPS